MQSFRAKSTLASRPMDVVQLQEDLRRPPERFRMYWIGHSTVLLQLGERMFAMGATRVVDMDWWQ
jgi:hypothetical protein